MLSGDDKIFQIKPEIGPHGDRRICCGFLLGVIYLPGDADPETSSGEFSMT
jgi:hypothetical protein